MKPVVLNKVTPEEVELFQAVSWVVEAIPDEFWASAPGGGPLRCHELARAVCDWVKQQPPLRWGNRLVNVGVIDGKYGVIDHSWLETGFGENILDVYVPGELPPVQLRVGDRFLPGEYVPGRLRGDIREGVVASLVALFEAADNEPLPPQILEMKGA